MWFIGPWSSYVVALFALYSRLRLWLGRRCRRLCAVWWSALALGRVGCQESRLELGMVSDPHVALVLVVGRPGNARTYAR